MTSAPRPKDGILDIAPYIGGKSTLAGFETPIKLSSNENILGCSPEAKAAYLDAALELQKYPDGKAGPLRDAVAAKFGLEPERLVFGCGSDEIFMLLAQVYLEPGDNIVQTEFGFMSYRIAARACQAEVKFAAQPNLKMDVDLLLAEVDERTKMVLIANPDNPTGAWLSGEEIRRLHEGLPGDVILVLDCAYWEFADDPTLEDPLTLAREAQNIVVTRTFSKIHGLAALRIGWGYAPPAVADALERIRLPFNVSLPAMYAAAAALGDDAFVARSWALVQQWRPWLTQQIGGLGLEVMTSQCNFILVHFASAAEAQAAEAHLASRGIIVRGLASYNMARFVRITIGLEEHNRALVDALAEFVETRRT
jgi:histidinol-phosphate aminotransferase